MDRLLPTVPGIASEQRIWFDPNLDRNAAKATEHYKRVAANLRKTLVTSSGLMPIGLLRDCMDYALQDRAKHGGVFQSVRDRFKFTGGRKLLTAVNNVYDFRNTYVAHQEQTLTDHKVATRALGDWIALLDQLTNLDPDAVD